MFIKPLYKPDDGSGSSGGNSTNESMGESNPPNNSGPITPNAPTPDAGSWESKYKGLQAVVEKKERERANAEADKLRISTELEDLKIKTQALQIEFDKLQGLYSAEAENSKTANTNLSQKQLEIGRLKLIVDDFPDLSSFEKSGVLPVANTVDELREKLTNFRIALKGAVGSNVKDLLAGSSPPSNDGQSPNDLTEDQIYSQLNILSKDNKRKAEYMILREKWDKIVEKREKTK